MPPPFTKDEYQGRLARVRAAMERQGLDLLVVGDPANMNWLTGFDAWSFYVPQIMVVTFDSDPILMVRAMDAGAIPLTTHLGPDSIVPYPENLVQRAGVHPADFMAARLSELGCDGKRIGYESDTYFFSPKCLSRLQAGLPNARWIDADLLVNWCRAVKSEAEIATLRQAARLAEGAMRVAWDEIRPGLRQCDLMAKILARQVGGNDDFGGDMTALSPLIMAGEASATAHPFWTDAPFEADQIVALELGGTRKRYNAGLARTVCFGRPPQALADTAAAVEEGLEAVLATLRSGVTAGTVHAAWQAVLDKHGLKKDSRIGYGIGVGYPPDWGEHTISLRAGEATLLEPDVTVHVMLGMWLDGWGMELSETVRVTETGCECLTDFPRGVHVVD